MSGLKLSLVLLALAVAAVSAQQESRFCGQCECTPQTYQHNILGQRGNCMQGWCYVRAHHNCPDKRASTRLPGLYKSYMACALRYNCRSPGNVADFQAGPGQF